MILSSSIITTTNTATVINWRCGDRKGDKVGVTYQLVTGFNLHIKDLTSLKVVYCHIEPLIFKFNCLKSKISCRGL